MNHPFAPLSEDEIDELERFLLYEIDSDETMTLDILDGYPMRDSYGSTTVFTLTRPLAYMMSNSTNLMLRSEEPGNQFVALRSTI